MPKPPASSYQMQFPAGLAVAFDPEAFDEGVRTQGTVFTHWRAMRCPVGLIELGDIRQVHDDHLGCSNGFLYQKAGDVTALFSGNGIQVRNMEAGILDSSTVQVTFPRTYDSSSKVVSLAPFDRLYLKPPPGGAPIMVPNWQLVQAHATGRDRLQFPAVQVVDLIDNNGIHYHVGQDFIITTTGQIEWTGPNRPGIEPLTGLGRIYSIRYLYLPFFYVQQMLHELRLSQIDDPLTGERRVERFAQAALLVRERVFEKNRQDPQSFQQDAKELERQVKAPDDGQFGPR